MNDTKEMLDIVEFLKTVRAMKSYIQILQKIQLPEKEKELTLKAIAEVSETSRQYMEEVCNGAV